MINKKKKYQIILGVVSVFILGVFWGVVLTNVKIPQLQGYLFKMLDNTGRYIATSANTRCVSCSNATGANVRCVSCSNATNSNATNSNATSTNIPRVLYLNSFSLKNSIVQAGDYVNLNLYVSGYFKYAGSVLFRNVDTGMIFSTPILYYYGEPRIQIPTTVVAGSYEVTDVLLVGGVGYQTFTRQYSNRGIEGTIWYYFNSPLLVKETSTAASVPTVKSVKFSNSDVKQGSKVGIYYTSSGDFYSLYLMFEGATNNNNKFNAYVKSLNSNPYFDVPSNVPEDSYKLSSIVVISKEGTRRYVQGTDYSVDSLLSVKLTNELDTYLYNNEDISGKIIQNLYSVNGNVNIVINADAMTVVNSELFNAIKGQNKKITINYGDNQMIFDGKDIVDSKAVDAEMVVKSAANNNSIQSLIGDGVVVHFADNGNLPGKALVRVQATSEVDQILGNSKVYVYHYNENEGNFTHIASEIKKTKDNYYEFTITHNSDYVLVKNKIDSSLVVTDANIVSFEKTNNVYLLLIVAAVIVILALTVVIIIQGRNKKNIKEVEKETKKDNIENKNE